VPHDLSPAQIASARATWQAAGLDVARFDQEFGPMPAPTTPEAIPSSADTVVPPVERSEAQIAHDAEWGFDQRHDPSAYRIGFQDAGILHEQTASSMVEVQNEWGGLLSNMQMTPSVGSHLAEMIIRDSRALAAMSDGQRQMWSLEQKHQALQSAGGPEALAERVRLATVALTYAMKQGTAPDRIEAILKSGVLDRAYTLGTLANHGARLEGWLAGPKRR
jgi:hypothetical protein